ncbi:MAG: group 1 truncated hemoglobin [Rhodobacterales bacterium]|nr:group 1 truncated hemoglobin [Rhodobacterales bacterium]
MTNAETLYYRYGSRITSGVSLLLYDRVLEDPQLQGYFAHMGDLENMRQHFSDMMCMVTGGPNIYHGRDLREAHRNLNISNADYDRLLEHLHACLVRVGTTVDEAQAVVELIDTLRDQVVSA